MGSTVASEVAASVGSFLRLQLELSLDSAFASRKFKLEDSELGVLVSPTAAVPRIISMLVPRVISRISSTVASKLNPRLSSAVAKTFRLPLEVLFQRSVPSVLDSRVGSALESVLISLPSMTDGAFGSCVYSSSRFCDLLAQKLFEELDVEFKSKLNMIISDRVGDTTFDQVIELDRLMLQAEKKSMLCDVLGRMRKETLPDLDKLLFRHVWIGISDDLSLRSLADQVRFLENSLACYYSLAGDSGSGFDLATSVVVSAIILSVVYQYLIGYVDKGGTKTYNSGSLEFRAIYVSLMLFQGAYVWIKFRDVASGRVSRRSRIDASGNRVPVGKWLPKFKPRREGGRSFNCLELAGYDTEWEAEVARQMAAFYYEKDGRRVQLEDGFWFDIPLTPEQDVHRRGEDRRKWVTNRVKEVFKEFKRTHDQWRKFQPDQRREFQRNMFGDVEHITEQGVDNANALSDDHPLPQSPLRSGEFLIAAPAGIQGSGAPVNELLVPESLRSLDAQNRQREPNAPLSSIPDNVEADSSGNHEPVADVLTRAFERTVDDLNSRGTKADYVRVGNKLAEMQDFWRELYSVRFGKDEEQSVSTHQECGMEDIQHQLPVLASQVHDPSLQSHSVPQPLWGTSDSLDAFREQADPFRNEFGELVGAAGGIEDEASFASTEDDPSFPAPSFWTFSPIEIRSDSGLGGT